MEKDAEHAGRKNASQLLVTSAESGQKLLRLLSARLQLPDSLLHRWIRTGQIRLNGSRTKPFSRVYEKDSVRLPPFLAALATNEGRQEIPGMDLLRSYGALEIYGKIIAWDKPAHLPVHGGSGHDDSLAERMKKIFPASVYKPAPAHRLDRDTTGIVLAGLDWESQRQIQEQFAKGGIVKEYLAWVNGEWEKGDVIASHYLQKTASGGIEKMRVLTDASERSRKGVMQIHPLEVLPEASLLHIRLFTGIKHQIRVQLAFMGFPIIGDGKYGNGGKNSLLLDAFRIILPDGHEISRLPPWCEKWLPKRLPSPLAGASPSLHKLSLDAENE